MGLSFLFHSAELKVNCPYVQGQSSSVCLFLHCKANILKFPPLSPSAFLFSFSGAFIRLLSHTPHCAPALHSSPGILFPPLPRHECDDWKFSEETENLELISSQIFCLLSYWAVKRQMRWSQSSTGRAGILFSAPRKTRMNNVCLLVVFIQSALCSR